MSIGLVYAVFCSLAWLGFDLARKVLSHRLPAVPLTVTLMYGQLPLFLALAVYQGLFLDLGAYWQPALLGGILNLGGNLCFILSIRSAPFSISVPTLSFTPVFAAVGSFLILDERLSMFQISGIGLVVVGSTLLFLRGEDHPGYTSAQIKKGVLLMILVSLFWAIVPVYDKICLEYASEGVHAFLQCLLIGVFLHTFLFSNGRKLLAEVSLKGSRRIYVVGLGFAFTALLLQLLAIQKMPVGIVEAVKRSIELGGSIICGFLFFREAVRPDKIVSIVLLAAGVFLVLLY